VKKKLIYTISDFNVPISCISSAPENNTILFVGLENGDIIKMNTVDNIRTVINAGNNRVYSICVENDTTLWVSLRNEGVKRVSNGIVTKKYYIPNPLDTAKPTNSYAAYDIKTDKDTFYFATSSGIYTLSKDEREKDLLLPYYRPPKHSLYNFGINQIFIHNRNIYAATSDSGLVVMNKDNPFKYKKLTSREIVHFYRYSDSILYASSSDAIYKINLNLPVELQKAIPIGNDERNIFAHMVIRQDGNTRKWTLTSTEMRYQDENGTASLQLSHKLSSSYKNYVYKGVNFIRVACYNKLYSFPLRQNLKGKSNNVIAACATEAGLCYFVTLDSKLYSVGKNENKAKFVGNLGFTIGEKPIKFYSGAKYLWLITNNLLYRINPDNAHTDIELGISGSAAKKQFNTQKIDFRSVFEKDDRLYLGTRNYLLRVKPDNFEKIDFIPTCNNAKIDFSDLYITDISNDYFASMKYGIFELNAKDSLEKIAGSDTIGEIRRFVKSTKDDSYIQTSKGIYKMEENTFYSKNVYPKSVLTVYDRADGFYIIGHKGIMSMEKKNDNFLTVNKNLDISANEAAIAEISDKKLLFVGAQTGLYKYDEQNNVTTIEIPPKNYTLLYVTLLIAGILLLVTVLNLVYRYQKRHLKNKLRRCSEKITRNIKKAAEINLTGKKNELENKLTSAGLFEIRKLNQKIDDFESNVEKSLLKRTEIIDAIKELTDRKVEEINEIVSDRNSRNEWNNILSIMSENINESSIDYSFNLLSKILEFERIHLKKAVIIREMTDRQKKDFEELKKIFITGEKGKNTENERETGAKRQREEERRNRIKLKCEELLDKYSKELGGLKLKNNTKRSYVALLLISGKFDNADIEETMNFNRVGDDRYNIHENLKQQTDRNALLEQLFENTRPSK
jgi:hypothetical protein